MNTIQFYLPISKVDAEQRLVYGYASTSALDLQGERVSLDALKRALPDYMQWRNIREMHQMSAVGVAESADIDKKGLYVVGRIVDDEAWKKVKEGVYKGFSIGGQRLIKNGDEITELLLTEISLVDRPANPECRIELYKRGADGEAAVDAPGVPTKLAHHEVPNRSAGQAGAQAAPVTFEPAEVGFLGRLIAKLAGTRIGAGGLSGASAQASSSAPAAEHPFLADPNQRPVGPRADEAREAGDEGGLTYLPYDDADAALWRVLYFCENDGASPGDDGDLRDGGENALFADCPCCDEDDPMEHPTKLGFVGTPMERATPPVLGSAGRAGRIAAAVGARADVSAADRRRALAAYGAVEFADPKNKKYPLDTPAHIRAAWSYFAMPKNRRFYTPAERAAIERRIIAAWKRRIDPAGPPAARAREKADSGMFAGGAGGSKGSRPALR
jgi:hypothetical protein